MDNILTNEDYDEHGIPFSQYYENRIVRLKEKYPNEQLGVIYFGHIFEIEKSSIWIRFHEDNLNTAEYDNSAEEYEGEFPLAILKLSLEQQDFEQLKIGRYLWIYTFKNPDTVHYELYKAIWTEKMIKKAHEDADELFKLLNGKK